MTDLELVRAFLPLTKRMSEAELRANDVAPATVWYWGQRVEECVKTGKPFPPLRKSKRAAIENYLAGVSRGSARPDMSALHKVADTLEDLAGTLRAMAGGSSRGESTPAPTMAALDAEYLRWSAMMQVFLQAIRERKQEPGDRRPESLGDSRAAEQP